jgi:hypothetical protein
MIRVAAASPEVFQERMEDLHRFVAQGAAAATTSEEAINAAATDDPNWGQHM